MAAVQRKEIAAAPSIPPTLGPWRGTVRVGRRKLALDVIHEVEELSRLPGTVASGKREGVEDLALGEGSDGRVHGLLRAAKELLARGDRDDRVGWQGNDGCLDARVATTFSGALPPGRPELGWA